MEKNLILNEVSNLFNYLSVKDIKLEYRRTGSFTIKGMLRNNSNVNCYIGISYEKNQNKLTLVINNGKLQKSIYSKSILLSNINLKNYFINFSKHVINTLKYFNIYLISNLEEDNLFLKYVFKTFFYYIESSNYINGFYFETFNNTKELKIKFKNVRVDRPVIYHFTLTNGNENGNGNINGNINVKYVNYNNVEKCEILNSESSLKIFIDNYGKYNLVEKFIKNKCIWTTKEKGSYKNLKGRLKFSDEDVDYTLYIENPNYYTILSDEGYIVSLIKLDNYVLYLDNYSYSNVMLFKDKIVNNIDTDNPILIWDRCLIESLKSNKINLVYEGSDLRKSTLIKCLGKYLNSKDLKFILDSNISSFWYFEE